jgi:transposase
MPTNNASGPIVYLAIELSVSSWVVACRRPANEKIEVRRMEAGDTETLLALISDLRRKASAEFGVDVTVASCFEAGRDGFWLHRLLMSHGVIDHVVEPTSILVTRGVTGDHDACRVVNVPSVAEEDGKRPFASVNISSRNASASKTASRRCWRPRASRKGRHCAHGIPT